MNDELIIQAANEEIETPSLGVTKQFLAVHEIVYNDGKPLALRVDKEFADGSAIVYFPVRDEKFYFAVYVDTIPKIKVRNVHTEFYNRVYFSATSDTMSYEELKALTKLTPTSGWSKGDARKFGNSNCNFSSIEFFLTPEPDEFEDKLKKLLDFLEMDKEGVISLVEKANGYIQVAINFHNGNGMPGGMGIDKDCIRRMRNLNLSIDFDLYAEGNLFKD